MDRLKDKVVVITGGARGLGYCMCQRFAEENPRVIYSIDMADGGYEHPLVKQVKLNITDRPALAEFAERVRQEYGRVDVLINNAGIALIKLFTETTAAEWKRVFQTNVTGTYYACKAVLPQMIRRQSGRIINVSSMWGQTGASCEVAYSASKAAVIGLTKALAKEVGLSGITVNCVAPGVIDTDMNAELTEEDRMALCEETPLARIGSPHEVAGVMLFLAGEHASFLTGQVIAPNGGIVI